MAPRNAILTKPHHAPAAIMTASSRGCRCSNSTEFNDVQELSHMSTSHLNDNAHTWRRKFNLNPQGCAALALVSALTLLAGCAENWAEVFPVSGAVTFGSEIPAGARIVLHPINAFATEGEAVVPTGSVKPDGSFVITSYQSGDGAPPGAYVATIEWYKFDEKLGGPGPNVIPAEYANPKTSPIRVTVKGGGPTMVDPIMIAAANTAARRPRFAPVR
jgi:hypothetical protein